MHKIEDFSPLRSMTSLKQLNIVHNSIDDTDISFLESLDSLEELMISFPEQVDDAPLGQVPSLRKLTVVDSVMDGMSFLSEPNSLESILIHASKITLL